MNKPCWKLAKACLQSQKLFCCRENNLLVLENFVLLMVLGVIEPCFVLVLDVNEPYYLWFLML